MRKIILSAIVTGLCAASVLGCNNEAGAKLKTVKKTVVVMEGATRELPCNIYKAKYTVGNKKKVSVSLNKVEAYGKVSTKNNEFTYGALATGKKAGTTKVTIKADGKKNIFTVKVIKKATVKKAAKKALKKYAAKLKNTKQCAYMDFNGDGLKDLYHDGKFSYYNYVLKKVVTKDAPISDIGTLYVSTKNHMMFALPAKETVVEDKNPNYADYTSTIYGRFFFMNEAMVFDFAHHTVDFSKYKYPEKFVKNDFQANTDYYFLDDHGYDQDDYWYLPYTKDSMLASLEKLLPGKKTVTFKTKPVIS